MTSPKPIYLALGHGGSSAYLAPGASAQPVYCPGAMDTRPSSALRIDDRAVEPETGFELLNGKLVASPASAPHGDCQTEIGYVLRAHVAPGYVVSTDLLTRTSQHWDFAADECIRKQGTDPQTGSRYLEELAFEVKYTQKPKMLAERARQLSQCGVRRIFAIWVETRKQGSTQVVQAGPVKEWDSKRQSWQELDAESEIADVCLARPLKVQALLSAVEADNAVARALLSRGNPVLKERETDAYAKGEAAGIKKGKAAGIAEAFGSAVALVKLCGEHGIEITKERLEALKAMSAEELLQLTEVIATQGRWPEQESRKPRHDRNQHKSRQA